jgi:hypothetical protein
VLPDVVLDERQRAARGRVVGADEPARAERPIQGDVAADHRPADPLDESVHRVVTHLASQLSLLADLTIWCGA